MPLNSLRSRLAATSALAAVLLTSGVLSGCAQPSRFGADTWQEEVLLHDGRRIIVERSQTYGGRHEVGQSLPPREHTLRFTLPNSGRAISWTSVYGEELGHTNFNPLAVHIWNNTAYVIAEPNLCISYNKWGRPNPPYVFFRHDGAEWRRVEMAEVPAEFKTINLVVSTFSLRQIRESTRSAGYVTAESVTEINENLRRPELKTIVRTPFPEQRMEVMCETRVLYKGAWILPNDPIARKFIDQRPR